MIQRWQSYIRANHWWAYKAAPILGFTYFYCYFFVFPLAEKLTIILLSAITITGIAGLGYVINDLYDIEADQKAGKKNPFDNKSALFKIGVIVILTIIATIPWYFLKSDIYIWISLAFQMLLFIVYAHPLTRLKEKSVWGPVCDALYGHAVPIIIACMTYQQYLEQLPYSVVWFFGSLFVWQFLKGMRNIFLHQLEDYENDMQSGIQTLTTEKGRNSIYQKILYTIIPLEIISLFIFFISVTQPFPGIWVYFWGFILLNIYGHGLFRNVQWHPRIYSGNTYIYFLNNFYEVYLPYYFIVLCIVRSPVSAWMLVIHMLLFPSTIHIMFKDLKMFILEIWVQVKNLLYPLYKFLQKKDI